MNLDISTVLEVHVIGGQIKHLLCYRTDMIIKVLQFIMGAPQISR